MKKILAVSKLKKVIKTVYPNAVSYKYENRRFTVINSDENFLFEFKVVDGSLSPRAFCTTERDKVAVTRIRLTKEAAEILLLSLAEIMGFEVIDERPPDYDLRFCDRCYQMTNHLDGVCQKCKTKRGIPKPPCTIGK